MNPEPSTHVNTDDQQNPVADILVSDAKKLIEVKYPKLHGRFNYAFNGLPDDMLLKDAIDAIASDVAGWLGGLPDNFKTSGHAISRPKFGLSYVLQLEEVRAVLGGEYCDIKNKSIERAFEALKKDFVVPSEKKEGGSVGTASATANTLNDDEDTVAAEGHDADSRILKLERENTFLKESLVSIINDQHGRTMGTIFNAMLTYKFE
jgi:hypothetical protein